jgi:hypothetical protein
MANSLNAATSTNTTQESELTLLNASSAAWDSNAVTVKASSGAWTTASTATGRVIQVVESVFNLGGAYHTHTSTSFVHAFSGAITPTSTSSKILIQVDIMLRGAKVGSGSQDSFTMVANIDRLNSDGSTAWQALSGVTETTQGVAAGAGTSNFGHGVTIRDNTTNTFYGGGVVSIMRLDSPASTDELVYDVVTRMVDQCTTLYVYDGQMIMQEISG